jgi:hypothetical protein
VFQEINIVSRNELRIFLKGIEIVANFNHHLVIKYLYSGSRQKIRNVFITMELVKMRPFYLIEIDQRFSSFSGS